MREFKFRAYDFRTNYMVYFGLGEDHFLIFDNNNDEYTMTIMHNEYPVMQWTGLTDKNGKEIYEGDILDFDEDEWGGKKELFPVEWDKDYACFDFGGGCIDDLKQYRKVIGNIYENPELLEDNKC